MASDKAAALMEQVGSYLQRLQNMTDTARASEELNKYLAFAARFHHYSPNNQLLIMFQRPEATRVAGYRQWQALGRQVRKGEKGIGIIAPIIRKDPETGLSRMVSIKGAVVFDLSQTDGDELPAVPLWSSPARQVDLQANLLALYDPTDPLVPCPNCDGLGAVGCPLCHPTQGNASGVKGQVFKSVADEWNAPDPADDDREAIQPGDYRYFNGDGANDPH